MRAETFTGAANSPQYAAEKATDSMNYYLESNSGIDCVGISSTMHYCSGGYCCTITAVFVETIVEIKVVDANHEEVKA